ncbi:hypothetical protein Rs2_09544 [Raphanus sativus]|nr:hypothetical protein Rs2_09544 [Raphanus sativus]
MLLPDSQLADKLKERKQKLENQEERGSSCAPWTRTWRFLIRILTTPMKSSGLERRDRNIQDLKQEQEQPSPVSVLERIRLEEETVEEKIRLLSFDDSGMNLLEKDSVHKFVKKVLDASRLNWTNLMARCNEETSTVILTRRSQQRTLDQIIETDVVKPSCVGRVTVVKLKVFICTGRVTEIKVEKGWCYVSCSN